MSTETVSQRPKPFHLSPQTDGVVKIKLGRGTKSATTDQDEAEIGARSEVEPTNQDTRNHSWTLVALQAPDAKADFTAEARKAEMQPVRKAKDERC